MRIIAPIGVTKVVSLVFCLALVSSCATMHESPDYNRHRLSALSTPFDRDDLIYFDVTTNAQYPSDDPAAENTRMEWLAAWLKQRKMCPSGFDIIQRRNFDFLEHNPGRFDYRYEVKCKPVVLGDQ